jgi:hypothetical protein
LALQPVESKPSTSCSNSFRVISPSRFAALKAGAVKYVLELERIADALTELVETGEYNPERDGELVPQ